MSLYRYLQLLEINYIYKTFIIMKTLKRSITVLVCLILFTSCTKSIDGKKEKSNIEVRRLKLLI